MPENSIKPGLPPSCPSCGNVGTVKQETTIKGVSTTLLWHCIRCDHRWPVKGSGVA
jgi:DNA-directed RNA polymerase subunit M/transcription elongation factor TFIIS